MTCALIASLMLTVSKVSPSIVPYSWPGLALTLLRTAGNEADYVIVSAVRSKGPGFLRSENRMNVMLTRCKKGMVIVTSRAFLQGGGRKTLLGQLAAEYEGKFGVEKTWSDWRRVVEGKAGGPMVAGVSARRLQATKTNTAPRVPAGSHAHSNAPKRRNRLRLTAANVL